MTPDTWGVTVTLAAEVTVPSASIITGMSARRAVATPTVLGGPPRPPAAPRPAPEAPEAPEAAYAPAVAADGRWVKYQASAAMAIRPRTATMLPNQRLRGGSVRGNAAGC